MWRWNGLEFKVPVAFQIKVSCQQAKKKRKTLFFYNVPLLTLISSKSTVVSYRSWQKIQTYNLIWLCPKTVYKKTQNCTLKNITTILYIMYIRMCICLKVLHQSGQWWVDIVRTLHNNTGWSKTSWCMAGSCWWMETSRCDQWRVSHRTGSVQRCVCVPPNANVF